MVGPPAGQFGKGERGAERVTRRTGWSPEEEETIGAMPPPAEDDPSTLEVLKLLISEGRDYAATEMERQKLRAQLIGTAVRDAAILGAIALFLLMGMLVALLVGAMWVLAPHIGPLLAALAVLGVSVLVIVILLLVARSRIRFIRRCISAPETRS